ncbi:SelB domain-containing protein [Lawsonia intracellularis]|uniref:SelB domain-containing protein n=1 Tax=Lawsonia intracellularis TaxID=29546 RepID=UPI0021E5D830|nr:SelB C-terminal domain-containing protein [Lawsonia intracellularis]UYH52616.1 SelB C-terminal domain-containing protein [Lawsonia intracellularis]
MSNILTTLNSTIKQATPIITLLLERKALTHITEDMYYSTQAIKKLKSILQNWFNSHKELDIATFKELSGGLPRKYSIPLLEYFDKEKLTIRIGDKRQLRNP